ncbi:MAG TPA: hypothetical protein VFC39_13070 [Acidobacteriaceae bacterium]|nr:hypothetical protein [Acidobacteriaceae bacterium]
MVESFKGDFEELAHVVNQSWAQNQQGSLLYSESFLQSALQQPGASLDLCPAVYEDGKLVAFGANFRRRVRMDDQDWDLVLDSFITVAESHKGRGLGAAIWRGLAESGQRDGADGLITMCVEGDLMNSLLPKIAERSGLHTVKALTIPYMGRPVPKDRAGRLQEADAGLLMRGAGAINEGVEFGRVWTQQEAEWQCLEREGAFGCSLGTGTISAYGQLTAGASPTLCGLVDDIVWGSLEADDRKRLAGMLLESAATAGVDLLLTPVLNYTDMTALKEVGFRKTRRTLNMYLTSWNPHFKVHELSSAYIDVF